MSDKRKEIGKRLQRLREERNLSKEQFGAMYKANENTVRRWESGEYIPKGRLSDIADFFGVSTEYIVHGRAESEAEQNPDVIINEPAFESPLPAQKNEFHVEYAADPSREVYLCKQIMNGLNHLSPECRTQALGYLQALYGMDTRESSG